MKNGEVIMRVLFTSILATALIVFILSINIVSYINFFGLDLIHNISNRESVNIAQIYFLFFLYIIISVSVHIPFADYRSVETEEEYLLLLKQELNNITYHITKISIISSILIIAMYYIK